jgi:hypothetical protein
MPSHVTNVQLAALRACLDGTQAATPSYRQIGSWNLGGLGYLSYAAFVVAVRRWFGSPWTNADVVRYVGSVRGRGPDGDDIAPLAAEGLIRQALGHSIPSVDVDPSALAILLSCLVADEELDSAGIDDLLATARTLADEWMTRPT